MTTTKVVTVKVDDKPGQLGKAARCLAKTNVNIEGFWANAGTAWFLTNNAQKAEQCLKDNGYKPHTEELVQVTMPNKPGALADVGEELGRAGINIDASFGTTGGGGTGTFFLHVKDPQKAESVIQKISGATERTPTPGIGSTN